MTISFSKAHFLLKHITTTQIFSSSMSQITTNKCTTLLSTVPHAGEDSWEFLGEQGHQTSQS